MRQFKLNEAVLLEKKQIKTHAIKMQTKILFLSSK